MSKSEQEMSKTKNHILYEDQQIATILALQTVFFSKMSNNQLITYDSRFFLCPAAPSFLNFADIKPFTNFTSLQKAVLTH